jgi:coniferyl-aldehyde dehydrogenase
MTSADTATLSALLSAQRSAFLREGPPAIARRLEDLDKLRTAVRACREQFGDAVNVDFGHRSRQETLYMDLMPVVEGIRYLQRNLERWARAEPRGVGLHFRPGSNRVIYQPLGVVGIISPWNYPVALALMPLATAIAAGNRAMIKPSELTPATSDLLASMLGKVFGTDQVAVVLGDASVGAAFASLPFDHMLFTGSTSVGRAVMRAASDNLVPVTLELGGKSPVVVDRGSSLKRAARSIAWGKLGNAGQTCVAPDYVLVAEEEIEAFITAFASEVQRLYPDIASNPDYATVINGRHHARLVGLLDDARAKGARVREIGTVSAGEARMHPRTFLPAIVTDVTDEMAVAREEIFGPILPVLPYRSIDDAISYINTRPRPLALYFFGPNGPARRQVIERTTSGGVSINDTLLQYAQDDMPFGGVGASGMGAYHGHEGFKTMSHAKGVFEQARFNVVDLLRPPFGTWFNRAMGYFFR